MNNKYWIGQTLLWCGFISAALFSVRNKEIDLLPEEERSALMSLNSTATVSSSTLQESMELDFDSEEFSIASLDSAEVVELGRVAAAYS